MRILDYRPGAAFWIAGGLLLFVGMAAVTQYKMTGRVDFGEMVNRDTGFQAFRDRNVNFELVDSYPRTSLVVVRDRETGRTAMLDLAVVSGARVEIETCEGLSGMEYSGASEAVCVAIHRPDTGDGAPFVRGVSFRAKAKDSQMGQFYRDLFRSRGLQVSMIQDSSRAVILEGEDASQNTVARVAIRSTFVFFATTELPGAGGDVRHR